MTNARSAGDSAFDAVDGGRLWVGGMVAACVVAGIVIVGILTARVLHTHVLETARDGGLVNVNGSWYAFAAAVVALAATGLLHLLLLTTPRPRLLFRWILSVATMIALVAPFARTAPLATQVTLAVVNLAVGVAIVSIVGGFASDVVRRSASRASTDRESFEQGR
jgi:cytochrome c biogenesis factor